MDYLYFPSCNFTKDSPQAAQKIRAYLTEDFLGHILEHYVRRDCLREI